MTNEQIVDIALETALQAMKETNQNILHLSLADFAKVVSLTCLQLKDRISQSQQTPK